MLKYLLPCCLVLCSILAKAQEAIISVADSGEYATITRLLQDEDFLASIGSNEASLESKEESFLQALYIRGFLEAHLDSIRKENLLTRYYCSIGPHYKWISLNTSTIEPALLPFHKKPYERPDGKAVNIKKLERWQGTIIDYYENNGFPFAKVYLDSISIARGHISASLKVAHGELITFDSVKVKGNAKLLPVYLYNYLGFKPGNIYKESIIRQISTRIGELTFLSEASPPQVEFIKNKAKVYVYIDRKRASQFDFVAGVLPDASRPGKVLLTGEANLMLQNALGRGERLEIHWKSPKPLTQDLQLNALYPYLLSTPFGIDGAFYLYKQDTSFINLNRSLGIQYVIGRGSYLKAFYASKQTSLLSTKRYAKDTILPDVADIKSNNYGLSVNYERLDYRFNPRSGVSLNLEASIGMRTIKKNSSLREEAYRGLELQSKQYTISGNLDIFIPLLQAFTLNLNLKGSTFNNKHILSNELFRIGGLKTLRGFDEQSIFASSYAIGRLELRYLLEKNSNAFLFYNAAWYERKLAAEYVNDTPSGFGAGISFETKLGIFSLTYALGKQFNNPIYFRSAKIHFGIVTYF